MKLKSYLPQNKFVIFVYLSDNHIVLPQQMHKFYMMEWAAMDTFLTMANSMNRRVSRKAAERKVDKTL